MIELFVFNQASTTVMNTIAEISLTIGENYKTEMRRTYSVQLIQSAWDERTRRRTPHPSLSHDAASVTRTWTRLSAGPASTQIGMLAFPRVFSKFPFSDFLNRFFSEHPSRHSYYPLLDSQYENSNSICVILRGVSQR